jgi:hypothetical protein
MQDEPTSAHHGEQSPRLLYHFTAPTTSHLGSILRDGIIRPTESNLSLDETHAGPDAVWLTSNPDPEANAGWANGRLKTAARLTVEIQDAQHWPTWSRAHGITDEAYDGLASVGDPEEWWISERPIRAFKIVALAFQRIEGTDEGLVAAGETVAVEGPELRKLFESRGRQRALRLPETVAHTPRGRSGRCPLMAAERTPCTECGQPVPPAESEEFVGWEVLDWDDETDIEEMICPGCLFANILRGASEEQREAFKGLEAALAAGEIHERIAAERAARIAAQWPDTMPEPREGGS